MDISYRAWLSNDILSLPQLDFTGVWSYHAWSAKSERRKHIWEIFWVTSKENLRVMII